VTAVIPHKTAGDRLSFRARVAFEDESPIVGMLKVEAA
jgi:hypothetical protein